MSQSKIIQSLYDMVGEQNVIDSKTYKKERDEVERLSKALNEYMGDDRKFKEMLTKYDFAVGLYENAMCEQYYREGFLCGARLALEICGFEKVGK